MEIFLNILFFCALAWSVVATIMVGNEHRTPNEVLMGMDSVVEHLYRNGIPASPFLVRKWISRNGLPVYYELDRYFTTTKEIKPWVKKYSRDLSSLGIRSRN